MSKPAPQHFRLHVPEAVLRDLDERLARVRWPETPPLVPWSTGTSVAYMQELAAYWRTRFDWRAQEARLNGFRQFKVPIAGIDLHFIHEQGKGPSPMPLLLSHGWPGSVVEFTRILPMLTDPGRFGGDPSDSFTVVAPSLPGYTLSFAPGQPRFGAVEIADALPSSGRSGNDNIMHNTTPARPSIEPESVKRDGSEMYRLKPLLRLQLPSGSGEA
jgi:microsomal epoxide hydrolase